jgi:hypothetical protein
MKLGIAVLVVACLVSLSVMAAEHTPADIRGTWVGLTNSAVYGSGQHHPGGKESEVRFRRIEVTFTIDKQEGRNFAGTLSSPAHSEPVVGAFASDLKSGVMADPDGSYTFKLKRKDRMDVCYTGSGGDNNTAKVAACYEVRKKGAKP